MFLAWHGGDTTYVFKECGMWGPAGKTKTTADIFKRGNLAQGIGYTGDGRNQKPKRGKQVNLAISHSREE